jgi:hypothetical protein
MKTAHVIEAVGAIVTHRRTVRVVLGLLLLLVAAWYLIPSLAWDGAVGREVRLTVINADGRPAKGVVIQRNDRTRAVTDERGLAVWSQYFPAGGGSTFGFRTGHWLVHAEMELHTEDAVHIVALGDQVESPRRSIRDKDPVELTIYLPPARQ